MRYGWLIPLALLALTHATGIVTVGLVTTGSMEPTLSVGSLFFSHRSTPEEDDIVVFTHPDGRQVVHRVVAVTDEGLITQGDANDRTDQAAGIPPVDPSTVSVVPTIGQTPAAVSTDLLKPAAILGGQALLLTFAIRRLFARPGESGLGWPLDRVRPSHLLFAAGFLLLGAAPFLAGTMQAHGHVQVQALVLPTLATVTSEAGTHEVPLAPLETETLEADGRTEIVRAPATPGTAALAGHGAVWAMLPTALVAWTGGGLLWWEGR